MGLEAPFDVFNMEHHDASLAVKEQFYSDRIIFIQSFSHFILLQQSQAVAMHTEPDSNATKQRQLHVS